MPNSDKSDPLFTCSDTATDAELTAKEVEMIRKYNSNDPGIGYNRWPKLKRT
jgi:hypothetical protein